MPNAIDTSYLHVFRMSSPARGRTRPSSSRRDRAPVAAIERSRSVVAEIHEYRELREVAARGRASTAVDGRLLTLEGRLTQRDAEGRAAFGRFACNLVAWVRAERDAERPRIAVVREISAKRVTLTAHPGLEPGEAVSLTFRMAKGSQSPKVTLVARVTRVWSEGVELDLDDRTPEPLLQAAA